MSNPHAHPHTMRKTQAKFQNNWYKTVRGVALTRDTLCLYNQGEKWLSSQCRKSDKNWSNNYVQSTCTSSYHEENTCKVSKQWVQNCKRSCAHKIPILNVDGWTDGRTNGRTYERRKLARLCLPAKAGATKMVAKHGCVTIHLKRGNPVLSPGLTCITVIKDASR